MDAISYGTPSASQVDSSSRGSPKALRSNHEWTNATMRKILIGGLIVVGLYASSEPANARGNGAWCARTNTGAGRVEENCGFSSIEACRRWVTGGNRGFCSRNPAYKKRQSSDR